MRLAITNSVALNGGDAAITLSLHEALQRRLPDACLEVHDSDPVAASRYYPHLHWKTQLASLLGPRLKIPKLSATKLGASRQLFNEARLLDSIRRPTGLRRRWAWQTALEKDLLSDIAQIEVMISTGGTYLVEQYPLQSRIFEYRAAIELDIPVIFFTQSLGPFRARRNRRLLKPVLERAPLVLLRDEQSLANVRDLGARGSHFGVVADAAFLAEPTNPEFSPRRGATDTWHIGISVRTWPPGAPAEHPQVKKFARAVGEGVVHLARRLGARFTFISTCQGTPEYRYDDSLLALRIAEELPADVRDSVQVDVAFHTPAQFRAIVGQLDLFIATRMHAAIQSLAMGTPVVPIAYEFKTRELAQKLGIADYALDIERMSGTSLISAVERFIEDLDDLREPLADRVRAQRAAAREGLELLANSLASIRR